MKLNKFFNAIMAVAIMAGFAACSPANNDVVKLKGSKITLTVGQTYTIGVENASGDITWASANEQVATVDANGTVTAVAVGSTVITATVGEAKATMDVTVEEAGQSTGGGAPDLEAPAEGKLGIVIEIPAGTACNGIALKGTFDGDKWSGADTYLGEDGAQTPVAGNIYKFAAIEGYANWYYVEIPTAENLQLKVCLIYAGDGSWDGQATHMELHDCGFSTIEPTLDHGDGTQVKEIDVNGGLLYLNVEGWKKSECVALEVYPKVTFNLTIPEAVEGGVYLHGPFVDDSWNGIAMNKVDDTHYTIEVENLEQNTEYQYTLAQDNWNEKGLFDVNGACDASNQKVTAAVMNDVVTGFADGCPAVEE